MASAPHPLAVALIERLQGSSACPILEFAAGTGRNGAALRRAGFEVTSVDDDTAASESPLRQTRESFAAVISTHGFLHGSLAAIATRVRAVAEHLRLGGLLYATFGSTRDARFGKGRRLGTATFAPLDGDERGVAHSYFDAGALRALLEPHFVIESLHEHGVDDVAGDWAHQHRPLRGAAHWFAIGMKR